MEREWKEEREWLYAAPNESGSIWPDDEGRLMWEVFYLPPGGDPVYRSEFGGPALTLEEAQAEAGAALDRLRGVAK